MGLMPNLWEKSLPPDPPPYVLWYMLVVPPPVFPPPMVPPTYLRYLQALDSGLTSLSLAGSSYGASLLLATRSSVLAFLQNS